MQDSSEKCGDKRRDEIMKSGLPLPVISSGFEFSPRLLKSKECQFTCTYSPDVLDQLVRDVPSLGSDTLVSIMCSDGTKIEGIGQIKPGTMTERPASRWQAFKERRFPGWLKRWFPVKKICETEYEIENFRWR